jgi:hypothetical protein
MGMGAWISNALTLDDFEKALSAPNLDFDAT